MSNIFSKLEETVDDHNKLRELVSLDDIINKNKNLTLTQKLNMSLDEIIEHKEIYENKINQLMIMK